MKIYVSHLRRGNYESELYQPILSSKIAKNNTFIFPHAVNQKPFNTRELFEKKGCDVVLAEISSPATGQGIELGWAHLLGIPIYCAYKKGSDVSGSAVMIASRTIEYQDSVDLLTQLESLFI